jgi:hypothetical protein
MRETSRIRALAFYLPQFHPIPENDAWWGRGFTEWTNTAKAKPMFPGHYQPRVPADLGFYDLRVPETRAAQAELAGQYGIDGFVYYHYWFAGRKVLERPLEEVVASGEPSLPFAVCWANQTWTGIWHGAPNRVLIEQTYPGEQDHIAHFNDLLPVFSDERYIRVDGKPLFIVYSPGEIPDTARTLDFWRSLAVSAGLGGLHIVGVRHRLDTWQPGDVGLDAFVPHRLPGLRPGGSPRKLDTWVPHQWLKTKYHMLRKYPTILRYEDAIKDFIIDQPNKDEVYQCLIPNWDNSPRSGTNGRVLHDWTPELWRRHAQEGLRVAAKASDPHRLVFIKSWNEWAEGNHLEPDQKYGLLPLEIFRDVKQEVEAELARDRQHALPERPA